MRKASVLAVGFRLLTFRVAIFLPLEVMSPPLQGEPSHLRSTSSATLQQRRTREQSETCQRGGFERT